MARKKRSIRIQPVAGGKEQLAALVTGSNKSHMRQRLALARAATSKPGKRRQLDAANHDYQEGTR